MLAIGPTGDRGLSAAPTRRRGRDAEGIHASMEVKIKLSLSFSVSERSLEDAMTEYDEVTVEGLVREILDKAIACDEISAKVEDGPNTLEELDELKGS